MHRTCLAESGNLLHTRGQVPRRRLRPPLQHLLWWCWGPGLLQQAFLGHSVSSPRLPLESRAGDLMA